MKASNMKLSVLKELDNEPETMSTQLIDPNKPCHIDCNACPLENMQRLMQRTGSIRVLAEKHNEENVDSYTSTVVNAIRAQNVQRLRQLLLEDEQNFEACNSNGEYLIHLACRRTGLETIRFLVEEAGVDVHARDDMGRSVLHDVCWRPKFDPEIMNYLLKVMDPTFLMMEDARGHTPLDYCRRADWPKWNTFLRDQSSLLKRRME